MVKEITSIFVVDDDEDDAFLICDSLDALAESRYEVTVFHSPREAIAAICESAPDVVLCDYVMGSVSGVDVLAEVRDAGIDVPIVLLTGMDDRSMDKAALEAGAADYISKSSLTPDILDRGIRYAIANTDRQRVFQSVIDNVNAAVALTDSDLHLLICNPEFAELWKLFCREEATEIAIDDFVAQLVAGERIVSISERLFEMNISSTPDGGSVLILPEVTEYIRALREREIAETRAASLAMNCSLTGIPNRNAFAVRIADEIRRAEADGCEFYLLNLDLNRFKEVNDIYGHSRGDQLLREISRRLAACCHNDDYVARLGGDEFIAIQRKMPGDHLIPNLALRMRQSIAELDSLDDLVVNIGVSIGVAVYPHHGQTAEELMSNADIAMYRAKGDPEYCICPFDEHMDQAARERRKIGHDLRSAIETGQLDVFFQAQADVKLSTISGFEALARWRHPEFGDISPSTFIPIAEENGLIGDLGKHVLERSCATASLWSRPLNVAVNVSPIQFRQNDLPVIVADALRSTGLHANRLELEVTESVLVDDPDRAFQILNEIKSMGVSIALDDFGTGFSSMSTLMSFPFDKIKIDRPFVEKLGNSHEAEVVTRAIVNMAHQLNSRTVAEGVQTPEQVEFLLREGCEEMQGFLIGRPVPNWRLTRQLSENGRTSQLLSHANRSRAVA